MQFEIANLDYDSKQDRATVALGSTRRYPFASVHLYFSLAGVESLKEDDLDDRMKDEARRILESALQAL